MTASDGSAIVEFLIDPPNACDGGERLGDKDLYKGTNNNNNPSALDSCMQNAHNDSNNNFVGVIYAGDKVYLDAVDADEP